MEFLRGVCPLERSFHEFPNFQWCLVSFGKRVSPLARGGCHLAPISASACESQGRGWTTLVPEANGRHQKGAKMKPGIQGADGFEHSAFL